MMKKRLNNVMKAKVMNGVFPKWNRNSMNSANSENLINH